MRGLIAFSALAFASLVSSQPSTVDKDPDEYWQWEVTLDRMVTVGDSVVIQLQDRYASSTHAKLIYKVYDNVVTVYLYEHPNQQAERMALDASLQLGSRFGANFEGIEEVYIIKEVESKEYSSGSGNAWWIALCSVVFGALVIAVIVFVVLFVKSRARKGSSNNNAAVQVKPPVGDIQMQTVEDDEPKA